MISNLLISYEGHNNIKSIAHPVGFWIDMSLSLHLKVGKCPILVILNFEFVWHIISGLHCHDISFLFCFEMQHMEIMMWCIRHLFLEKVKPRFINYSSWKVHVRDRKSAATERAMRFEIESSIQEGSLFVEDALLNLEGDNHQLDTEDEIDVTSLQKENNISSVFRPKINLLGGSYPFENLRTAADLLFLHGSSDLVVAKRAIVSFLSISCWLSMEAI